MRRAVFALSLLGLSLFGCSCSPAAVVPTVDLVACIIVHGWADANAVPKMSDAAIVADVAAFCAADIPLVIATLAKAQKDMSTERAARAKP